MGFGPNLPNNERAVQAVCDIVSVLYPERSTERALDVLRQLAATLMAAKVPLTFGSIDRFLNDPDWRRQILQTTADHQDPWSNYDDQVINPAKLDADFAWLLQDRLQASRDSTDPVD